MIISSQDQSLLDTVSYLSTPSPGFFYLFILQELNRTTFEELAQNEITLTPLYRTPTKYYFNQEQIDYLSQKEWAILKRPKKKNRLLDFTEFQNKNIDHFIVIAPPHWNPDYAQVKHLTNLTFIVPSFANLSKLYSDSAIDSITPIYPHKFYNRYVSGFIQDQQNQYQFLNDHTITKQTLHQYGLTGENVTVSLFDSGLTVFSGPPHLLLTKANVTMQFNTEMNDLSHGTHCAGTIAGWIDDPNSSLSLYQGVAPNAIVQSWLSNHFEMLSYDPKFQRELQYITSCSWGMYPFQSGPPIFRPTFKGCFIHQFAIDALVSLYPETLFIFAAGNEGIYSICFPAACKNVLTVGATSPSPSSAMEYNRKWFIETASSRSVRCETVENDPYQKNPLVKLLNLTNVCIVKTGDNPPCASDPKTELIVSTDSKYRTFAKGVPAFWAPNYYIKENEPISLYCRPTALLDRSTMDFSSRYPTQHGLLKPDLSAPGSNTHSADSRNINGLYTMGGTSTATPAVAGLAAMLRQYFIEGWYPKNEKRSGEPIQPLSMLMKAVLVNSAVKLENDETTPGEPDLSYGIGFKSAGFRCYQGKIQPKEVKKFIITTTKVEQFSVTMSWLDSCPKSIQKWEDDLLPTCGDLDLLVISPSGKVYYGNEQIPCEVDTKEKILIKRAEIGDYQIIVMAPTPFEEVLPFAIAVTGGFDQKADTNILQPIDVTTPVLECRNGGEIDGALCKCPKGYHGNFCEEKYEEVMNDKFTFTLKAGQVRYFHYQSSFPSGYFDVAAPKNERLFSTLFASNSSFQKIGFSTHAWRWRDGGLEFTYGSIPEIYFAIISGTPPSGEEFTVTFKQGAAPTPIPTETPPPTEIPIPTETPIPTEIPIPTETPIPTEIPIPTETPTPIPTETPTPIPIPTETPTPTPIPTETPTPTIEPTSEIIHSTDSGEEPESNKKQGLSMTQTIYIVSGVSIVVITVIIVIGVYFLRKVQPISVMDNDEDLKEDLILPA